MHGALEGKGGSPEYYMGQTESQSCFQSMGGSYNRLSNQAPAKM